MQLQDLDELVLLCRDTRARVAIAEAVACYKAGAYRSAIVATWIAVVFDFVHKLRELELSGDKNARKKLEQFDKAREKKDVAAALSFEREMLDSALNEFELISPIEYQDMQRLLEDRNRCAHPSMVNAEDPYEATAELARYHIRNAVTSLLQQSPVQGKAALDRIWQAVRSEFFPTDQIAALAYFKSGPLTRARKALVKGLVIGATKALLQESLKAPERLRLFAALNAVLDIQRQVSEEVLKEILPDLSSTVEDEKFWRVISYVSRVPGAWDWIKEASRIKATNFIKSAERDEFVRVASRAVFVPALQPYVLDRLGELTTSTVLEIAQKRPRDVFAPELLSRLKNAGAFRVAEEILELLAGPYLHMLSSKQLKEIKDSFIENNQVYLAWRAPEHLLHLIEHSAANLEKGDLKAIREKLNDDYYENSESAGRLKAVLDDILA